MSDYEIVDTNADNIEGCSICGYKNPNNLGYRRKTNWLKERYADGLRACLKIPRGAVFAEKAGGRGATKEQARSGL